MARRHRTGKPRREQSRAWIAATREVAQYHRRIVEVRDDRVGKAVRAIVDRGAETIVMREASVKTMLRRPTSDPRTRNVLAPAVHAARMGEMRARIVYKQTWAGGKIIEVPAEYPTTRRCSACGAVRDTEPDYPTFRCGSCGHTEDRDDNAAKNLKDYRAPSGDPAASGRSGPGKTGGQPPAQSAREPDSTTAAQAACTAPDGSAEQSATPLGSANRARPGAPTASMSVGYHVPITTADSRERRGDAPNDIERSRVFADGPQMRDRDRSQTDMQPGEILSDLLGSSERLS